MQGFQGVHLKKGTTVRNSTVSPSGSCRISTPSIKRSAVVRCRPLSRITSSARPYVSKFDACRCTIANRDHPLIAAKSKPYADKCTGHPEDFCGGSQTWQTLAHVITLSDHPPGTLHNETFLMSSTTLRLNGKQSGHEWNASLVK